MKTYSFLFWERWMWIVWHFNGPYLECGIRGFCWYGSLAPQIDTQVALKVARSKEVVVSGGLCTAYIMADDWGGGNITWGPRVSMIFCPSPGNFMQSALPAM